MSQIKNPFAHKFTPKMAKERIIQVGLRVSAGHWQLAFGNWTPDADKSLGCRQQKAKQAESSGKTSASAFACARGPQSES